LPIRNPRAVTFDCWQTLMVEVDPAQARLARIEAVASCASRVGRRLSHDGAREVLDAVLRRHQQSWHAQRATTAHEAARWALESLQLPAATLEEVLPELGRTLALTSLASEMRALEGARATLERLAESGIRRALICDTGLSPGKVVRQLLARVDLLDLLEVQIFSDELGVTKPHARMFEHALLPLGVSAADALHVGDLRRTDIAGARAMGMQSVRIRDHFDDSSQHPEADAVADSHAHLCQILGLPDR
jgi:HAD superfamily hydrolase (TIGR01549 family)